MDAYYRDIGDKKMIVKCRCGTPLVLGFRYVYAWGMANWACHSTLIFITVIPNMESE